MQKQINSTYLVAQYLIDNDKSYIHDIKRKCKANNPMQRILTLRKTFNWQIDTIFEGYQKGVAVYYYRLTKEGKMPNKFR